MSTELYFVLNHIRCFKYVISIEDDEDLDERMKRGDDAGDFWATRWCENLVAFY